MAIFDIGIKILLIATPLFFLIFFPLCVGWSKPQHPERNLIIGFLVSTFYTFLFFLTGTGFLAIISLLFKYYPDLIKSFSDLFSL